MVEKAEAYRQLSAHNMEQARIWYSKKTGPVAGHYAKESAKYRKLAEQVELEIFDGTIVRDRLGIEPTVLTYLSVFSFIIMFVLFTTLTYFCEKIFKLNY